MSRPVIAVIGATGAQGGGLVRAMLADPQRRFQPRALTRRPYSPAALALAKADVELRGADLDDVEALATAFAGAHGVFALTNFWEHLSPGTELAQAANVAAAAQRAGVRHVVWSTLEDTRQFVPLDDPRMPTLMGRYKVPHFDAKGEANEYFTHLGVPTTFMYTSFYWDNLIHFGMGPQRDASGNLMFTLPMDDRKLPGIAGADIGVCAFGIFAEGTSLVGARVGIAGEHLTGAEMADALTHAVGEPVRHFAMPPEQYAKLGFPGADDLANMFQFKRDFNEAFCGLRSVQRSRALNPGLMNFEQWLQRHRSALPIPPRAHRA